MVAAGERVLAQDEDPEGSAGSAKPTTSTMLSVDARVRTLHCSHHLPGR
jgi:hypothetical protein